jgi:hypothetical protein
MKLGGKNFGLQSGTHDALKFVSAKDADTFMNKAFEIFGNDREFEIVPVDGRFFGRAKLQYVYGEVPRADMCEHCGKDLYMEDEEPHGLDKIKARFCPFCGRQRPGVEPFV